ncbi:phosphatidylinositol-3,5-bisphosphate 5-phosphatase, partial [Coemansia guatemalensis]
TGIVRSNCIDCLDRTNAAQSIVGKVALAHQLFELGQIDEPYLSFNTDAAMIIEEMYHDLGNTIALQYGGSHLVNTVQTYRRSTNWRSHSRDIVESLRRYYSNSLLDMERQEAITFFVEKSIFPECNSTAQSVEDGKQAALDSISIGRVVSRPNQVGKPMSTQWWTTLGDYGSVVDSSSAADSSNTESPRAGSDLDDASKAPTSRETSADSNSSNNVSVPRESETAAEKAADGYWNEYYRPHQYTSFDELFVGSLNSSASLHPSADIQNIPSPFADRGGKGRRATSTRARYIQREPKWLKSESDEYANPTLASRQEIYERLSAKTIAPQTLLPMSIGGWMTDGITAPLQEPRVCQSELEEYEKYVHQFDDLKKWIVPPSTLLYSDYLKSREATRSFAESAETAQYFAPAPHNLRIDTSAESLYGPEDGQQSRRSQTPIPGEASFPRRAPHSALPARSHRLRRLLGPQSLLSPTGGRQQSRQRSSTSSDRGSLWGLWSQSSSVDQQQQQQQQDEYGLEKIATVSHLPLSTGSSQFPRSPLGLLSARSGFSNHDRSRSLDFSSIGSTNTPSPLAHPAPPIHTATSPAAAANDGVVLEPRVTEADLNIYQNYIKMRKAMSSLHS